MIEILHDEDNGKELAKRAQNLTLDKSNKKQNEMLGGKGGISSETPIMIADCDIKRLGYIKQLNISYAKLFGYTPIQLEGVHLSKIQPEVISAGHNQILEHYITSEMKVLSEGEILMIPGVHRNTYMFPIWQE